MNGKTLFLSILCLMGICAFGAAPTVEELKTKIRPDHPRLFLTPEEMPTFGERIRKSPMFPEIRAYVATLPENPSLELKEDVAKWEGDKIVFLKKIGDQNAVTYAFRYTGGNEAVCCALMYFATGEERYREMAVKFLKVNVDFCAVTERSRILPEWYNTGRLCAIIAWDWLYNTMTPQQRQELMEPLLKHIEFMRNPGFPRNGSWAESGYYGENALLWHVAVAAYGEKYSEDLIKKHLKDGYQRFCQMMDFREKCSGGRGVLSSITTGYSMAYYPYASFHFLMTLQSACCLDLTGHWIHMRDFDVFASWMMIPDSIKKNGFVDFGWGDASKEYGNGLWFSYMLYNHMAQQIHLYGESADARTLITMLPEKFRKFDHRNHYPFLAFVVPRFSPEPPAGNVPERSDSIAVQFPSYGLTVMRSGTTMEDTYASFKGGAWYDNHQHYDENTFIIYKKGFQAVDSGTRGNGSPHHLLYYPQTVAHNAILIRGFQEPVAKHWYPSNGPKLPENVWMDGGQNKRTVAKPLPFAATDSYTITGGDATACYAPEKCKEA
ncbi:MAG: heparinase II/III family protein, partial [Lentisphaeria bacterium]|nr:heparinase II/III family protein [Lentisphaeria bacterium]